MITYYVVGAGNIYTHAVHRQKLEIFPLHKIPALLYASIKKKEHHEASSSVLLQHSYLSTYFGEYLLHPVMLIRIALENSLAVYIYGLKLDTLVQKLYALQFVCATFHHYFTILQACLKYTLNTANMHVM